MFDYLNDPQAIYEASFKAIRKETDFSTIPESLQPLAERVVHSVANPEIVTSLKWSDGAAEIGIKALKEGAAILCDAEMVKNGIITRNLPAQNEVVCTLNEPSVPGTAKRNGTTRSAAAVELWMPYLLEDAIVAIGNAPTTLFYLLERIIEDGWPAPALILGFPVGFIGAAESKQALIDHAGGIPYITLKGRLGGSAMAASAVNALANGNEG